MPKILFTVTKSIGEVKITRQVEYEDDPIYLSTCFGLMDQIEKHVHKTWTQEAKKKDD